MWCLGLAGGYFHDAAAALFHDGQLVSFIEEERLTRIRFAPGARPRLSALHCLTEAGITLADVELVALAWNPYFPQDCASVRAEDPLIPELFPHDVFGLFRGQVRVVDHQLAHAASVYRTSGANKALVISVDGSGDGKSAAVYRGESGSLAELESLDITQSLGWFYQRATTYLGLGSFQNAGKTMALAALGEPRYTFDFIHVHRDDGFRFTHQHAITGDIWRPSQQQRSEYYARQRDLTYDYFKRLGVPRAAAAPRVDRVSGDRMYEQPSVAARDLAASAQTALEDALTALVRKHVGSGKFSTLCLAGGVAMNCKAVGELPRRIPELRHVFVSPVSGDMGGAIGAALEVIAATSSGRAGMIELDHAYWGPGFSDEEVSSYLSSLGLAVQQVTDPSAFAADMISNGRTVGWFQGRMEVGARALGNRSILARTDLRSTADFVNARIKNREPWRPFSPSIIQASEFAKSWDEPALASPFMTVALRAVEESRVLAAVCHVDGTSRVQAVVPGTNPRFEALINAVGLQTEIPAVLNTSLNGRDEPIACRPADAVRLFATTPLDILILGRSVLRKDAA